MAEGRRVAAPILFAAYAVGAFAVILAFGFAMPLEREPLPPFRGSWRFFQSVLSYVSLFPAVALSAIAGSFGFGSYATLAEDRFEPRFMDEMKTPLLTVIVAAAFYAAISLFARPIALDAVGDMKAKGVLFTSASEKAATALEKEEWLEASAYLAVCQRVWPNSPITEESRERLAVGEAGERASKSVDHRTRSEGDRRTTAFPGVRESTTATKALESSRKAFAAGRYYDAHWFATLAERLAGDGSPEKGAASRMAADAWNAIAATEPRSSDKEAFSVFKRKRDGYAAILSEDWIRAYYIYEKLAATEGDDPDVLRFGRISEQGTKSVSFFADEVGAFIGSVDFDVFLSVPRDDEGRDVLRIKRLHPFADAAYGEGLELLSFRAGGKLRYRIESAYVKLVPLRIDQPDGKPIARTALLMLALDRDNENKRWMPQWRGERPDGPDTRVVLDAPYDTLLLAARARKGPELLSIPDLNRAVDVLPAFGFIAETLRAEIMRRLSEPFAFLSLGVFVLAIAWRTRSHRSAGLGGILVLLILPFSMNVFAQGYRILSLMASTLFSVAMPVSASIVAVLAFQSALLLTALVFLAGQRA